MEQGSSVTEKRWSKEVALQRKDGAGKQRKDGADESSVAENSCSREVAHQKTEKWEKHTKEEMSQWNKGTREQM